MLACSTHCLPSPVASVTGGAVPGQEYLYRWSSTGAGMSVQQLML